MLSSACALHFQGCVNHIVDHLLYLLTFDQIVAIIKDGRVEITIADMAEYACEQSKPV